MIGDLCIDEDRHDFGVIEIVRDEDEQLLLMAQSTWDFIARFNLRSHFAAAADVEPGIYSLGDFVAWSGEPVVISFELRDMRVAVRVGHGDDYSDLRQHAEQADPDVDYCVAAPSCLQDIVHRRRGFPICAYHDQQMSEVDDLLSAT